MCARKGVNLSMRDVLLGFLLCISGFVSANGTEPTLAIDSSGNATICLPKDSTWNVRLEQYRWNKWIFVNQVLFERNLENDTCVNFPVEMHSGANRFRLRKLIYGKPVATFCDTIIITNFNWPVCDFSEYGQGDTIILPFVSMWELYDAYGNLIWQGQSQRIPVKGLREGDYYFCYDNRIAQIAVFHEDHRKR